MSTQTKQSISNNPSPFEDTDQSADNEALCVALDGFEGPLDVLLELARRQKVDLRHISILALTEQYLAFIDTARDMRLELAADYLVMAAWLAYLKSRLLLPVPPVDEDEPPITDELAAALKFKLQRLEAIRRVSLKLEQLPQLNKDVFTRGSPCLINVVQQPEWQASIYDVLSAYGLTCQKRGSQKIILAKRHVCSLIEAREMLMKLVPEHAQDWLTLDVLLKAYMPKHFASHYALNDVKASSFNAALEMVREGHLSIRQERAFAPLWLRQLAQPDTP